MSNPHTHSNTLDGAGEVVTKERVVEGRQEVCEWEVKKDEV